MKDDPEEIRDTCRKKLTKYLIRALSIIPHIEEPLILDIGCGTGVPTLILADFFGGHIYAVDVNKKSLSRLEQKIIKSNLTGRVSIFHLSAYEMDFKDLRFDIVLAEGLLNIIGFEKGLSLVNQVIRNQGYFIIHDEYADHGRKKDLIKKHGFRLMNFLRLNEDVWWDEYYACLEKSILSFHDSKSGDFFRDDLKEIELYKKDPGQFRSVYYILEQQ